MLPNSKATEIIDKYIRKFLEMLRTQEIKDIHSNGLLELSKNLIDELTSNEIDMLVKTDDGTYTLKSEDTDELMHSRVGALTEGIEKFAIPSMVEMRDSCNILDLCSGMGYNAMACLSKNKNCNIDMVEISKETLFLSLCLDIPLKEHELIKEAYFEFFNNFNDIDIDKDIDKDMVKKESNSKRDVNGNIQVFNDDARVILQKMPNNYYDIVCHDAFSPARDPVLYTVEFLDLMYKKLKDGGMVISYSSSIPFRSALFEIGYNVYEGVSVGRKRGITIAFKGKPIYHTICNNDNAINENKLDKNENDNHNTNNNCELQRISEVDERLIALSPIGIPYYDEKLDKTSEEIIFNRDIMRDEFKNNLSIEGYNEHDSYIYSTKRIKSGKIDEKLLNIQKNSKNSVECINLLKKELFR
ncbi:tRNA U34 5-methylaminomethyl-2-thiouridine-forming methyltransferase MnmC [Methanococcus voltae]|uniref:tRNA U34 5-methylaminomethyl-2-thiouridine-forming methyltransferase MnmC n=1 Tax=Methanococcus voltae TaxID=2188 RepID=A0A8J7UR40_METVO|nr:MnmC family methyltransferase [Methanococcus voltae]MBP2201388.1 tRNA U34 5-methylaminomethyl-2-thiouridine-forming methyltransferase MnmC [Methanococcus voltae]